MKILQTVLQNIIWKDGEIASSQRVILAYGIRKGQLFLYQREWTRCLPDPFHSFSFALDLFSTSSSLTAEARRHVVSEAGIGRMEKGVFGS